MGSGYNKCYMRSLHVGVPRRPLCKCYDFVFFECHRFPMVELNIRYRAATVCMHPRTSTICIFRIVILNLCNGKNVHMLLTHQIEQTRQIRPAQFIFKVSQMYFYTGPMGPSKVSIANSLLVVRHFFVDGRQGM